LNCSLISPCARWCACGV